MKLVSIRQAGSTQAGSTHAGVVLGDQIVNLAHELFAERLGARPASVKDLFAGGEALMGAVRRLVDEAQKGSALEQWKAKGAVVAAAGTQLAAPLPCPTQILAGGRAYRAHTAEMQGGKPTEGGHPHAFLKNGNAVIGPGEAIRLPKQCPDMVDYEGEFSIVIGRYCHNVTVQEAKDYIGGYTLINDVSARNWNRQLVAGQPDWEFIHMGKQLPTFCPLGPAVVTADEIPNPDNVQLVTRLNGKVMQDANTDDLIFPVAETIAYFSRWYPFAPGDVITTGSPSGVGFSRKPPVFLAAGDVVSVWVDKIGELSNPVLGPS